MGRNKSTCARSPEGFRIYEPEGGSVLETGSENEIVTVVDIGLRAIKATKYRSGSAPLYSPDSEGLKEFTEKIEAYFEALNQVNADRDSKNAVLPDIEGLCLYLGFTRKTLNQYQRERSVEWQNVIALAKETVLSVKKQMLASGKGNSLGLLFDIINNSDYRSTNEFHREEVPFSIVENADERQRRLADKYRVSGIPDKLSGD